MIKTNMAKLRKQHRKVVFCSVAVILVAILIEMAILYFFNGRSANKTSLVMLNQVVSILQENEKNENELIDTLKEDYIIRAQTVSYILDSKPEAEKDVDELKKIASLMRIDEIHLFDENGKIYSGSEPKYYGLTFDSGEQIGYFKPMLKDKSLKMCQDVTPNTAEKKSMMYAITWNEAGDKMIQVGIEPVRLMEELRENEMSEVIDSMPTYEGIDIWVADADSREICAATKNAFVGSSLDKLGITETSLKDGKTVHDVIKVDGYRNYCSFTKTGDYIVLVTYSTSANVGNFILALVIEFVYLSVAGFLIVRTLRQLLRANTDRETQMAILASMSDIYNSMHLIDLESNTMMEYSARDEVSEFMHNTKSGADVALQEVTAMMTEDDCCEEALTFTDLRTLSERMQKKKIISDELVSKVIGWYRASFIAIDADEEGHPRKVIYVTQDIDREKKKEEELILKSNVDELTGLYNRRAFEDDIEAYGDVVPARDFVFVSFDVNGLKTVNDSMGHVAGDELLIGAADCMKRCFEPYGKVYRVGGDEFAAMIFVGETELQGIKKAFENTVAKWSGSLVKSLSISCGYVMQSEVNTNSVHEIANIADQRMYEVKAKHYGRVRES